MKLNDAIALEEELNALKPMMKRMSQSRRERNAWARRRGNGFGPRFIVEQRDGSTDRILESGELFGYRWFVYVTGMGFRNGYVEVPRNHPWVKNRKARDRAQAYVYAHFGISFLQPSERRHGKKFKWWFGFDTGHYVDAADPEWFDEETRFSDESLKARGSEGWFPAGRMGSTIKSSEYVASWCKNICAQAAVAAGFKDASVFEQYPRPTVKDIL